jgi:ERF superfamily protein
MNAIAPLAESVPATAESPPLADSLLNFVARAMADPSVNVDKLQLLLSMQREIVADDARLQFNRSMSLAQSEMQPVLRDAANDQTRSKYARLETIDAAVRPIYTRHGFCLEFNSEAIEGPNERIVCEVSHTAGHTKKFQLEAAPDMAGPQGRPNKTPLHGLGSTVSYLRRYLTCMIFNVALANDDNDGNRQQRGRISPQEVEELNLLMRQTQTLESKFLAAMCPALRSIEEAPANDFTRLKNALLTKRAALAKRAAANARTGEAA